MDWTAIILALIGGGVVTKLLDRIFKKKDDKDEILVAIKELQKKSDKRDIEVSKILLTILLEHNPKDHKSILDEALRYFGVLGGDSWMWDKLSDWAKIEDVDISYLKSFHEQNMKKKA